MNTMTHDNYTATIGYDEDLDTFFGQVVNLSSPVTFHGDTPKELRKEMAASLDVYFQVCKERGVAPEKPLSGKLNLRLGPELHGQVTVLARAAGKSINAWIVETIKYRFKVGN